MKSQSITFPNGRGQQLAAHLDVPAGRHPHAFAVFAHCFTCGSSLTASRNICRALNLNGVAVLRFDFTGLGRSEGDFIDTNFTTNISDLVAAGEWLERTYRAPELLIGHSLGGAAVLCAATKLPSVKAVATIGAPFAPDHVSSHFAEDLATIAAEGHATVDIGGRPFRIAKQFLDDLNNHQLDQKLSHLRAAALFLHSPQDKVVGIKEAAKLYAAARHPKSFVSLDGADHLLSDKADSQYVGQVIAGWSGRYIPQPVIEEIETEHTVAARLGEQGYTTEIRIRRHQITSDEPEKVGGNDFGPGPYELVSAGLGACTAMTIQMYARRKNWPVEEVEVHLNHRKDYAEDMEHSDERPAKIDRFDRLVILRGPLTAEQRARLLEIADRCPVHRTLHETVEVRTTLAPGEPLRVESPPPA